MAVVSDERRALAWARGLQETPDERLERERRDVRRTRRGDRAAFARLVQSYQGVVYGLCLRMVRNAAAAEDLTQDVFVKAHRALDQYDDARPLRPWLLQIARNASRDYLKSARRRETPQSAWGSAETGGIHVVTKDASQEHRVGRRELREVLDEALSELAEIYREAVVMKYVEDLSYKEMAAITGLPVGTLRVRVLRAREKLIEQLGSAATMLGGLS